MDTKMWSPNHYRVKPSEVVNETKQKKKKLYKGALQHFRDYCSSCGLHGMTYLGQDRTWIEYIWWITVFILAVCGCIFMIYGIIIKWIRSPVLVSFATQKTPIYNVPFPSVTVCPINRVNKEYFNITKFSLDEYNMTDTNETTKDEILRTANYMDMVCGEFDVFQEEQKLDYLDPDDLFSVLDEHRPEVMIVGIINDKAFFIGGENGFQETITQQGLCYTYNRMRLDEIYTDIVVRNEKNPERAPRATWNPATGFRGTSNISATYPKRATAAGVEHGLVILIIDRQRDIDYECNKILVGFSVTLHYAGRMPRTVDDFFLLPANEFILVPVHTSIILTSETVRAYEPAKRDCVFPSERHLKYFKMYTQKNCELECSTNITLAGCGCVEFYMPRENGTKICGPRKKDCISEIKKKKKTEMIQKKLNEEYGVSNEKDAVEEDCNCLPMCTDITYKHSIEPLQIREQHMRTIIENFLGGNEGNDSYQFSGMVLYLKDEKLETTERNELYGPTDFIANFGGLLGLFTGFSLLSCLEIVYFLTLRIYGNIRLFGYWAGLRNNE